jgi:two-component system cell cycle response regulator DivK
MSKRMLVVEDQEDLRTILRDFLSASGYTIIEAVDGAESVAKAASERPDLVLMDIQLPVLDGYDATRQIKALPGLAAIPIIAVSSFAMKGDEEKARASGCDDYVCSAAYGVIWERQHSANVRIVGPVSGGNVNGINFSFGVTKRHAGCLADTAEDPAGTDGVAAPPKTVSLVPEVIAIYIFRCWSRSTRESRRRPRPE